LAHDPVILSSFTGNFQGKEIRPGKSGDTVNLGTVNRGFTVALLYSSIIIASAYPLALPNGLDSFQHDFNIKIIEH
jgi:hypothetical protein